MEISKVKLSEKFGTFTDLWNPKIIGRLNKQLVKIAKLKGEFVMHQHEAEDELFMVIKGELFIDLEDQTLKLNAGEFVIIPKGVLHKPYALEEVQVMLFEPEATLNTGNKINELTVRNLKEI